MIAVDLFAGGGGVACAMRALGLRAIHVEKEPWACATLRAMGEPMVFEGDVRAIHLWRPAEPVGVLWASPPCPLWSRATSRTRDQAPDGWPWTLAAIDMLAPRVVAIENVKQAPRQAWARDLEERGYRVVHGVLNAADYGVRQTRNRSVLLASLRGTPALPTPTTRNHLPLGPALEPIGARVVYPEGLGRAASEPWRLGNPSPTVMTTEVKGTRASAASGWTFNGGPDRASDATFLAIGLRRITVTEAARLQGFPEGHPFQGTTTERYTQAGNAVPPPLAHATLSRGLELL